MSATPKNAPAVRKPVIAINGDFRPSRKDVTPLSWFNTGYYDSVAAAKGLPVLIPPYADDNDLRQMLKMVDGVVLAGCTQDLDPARLGLDKHPSVRIMPPRREDFDRRLATMAIEMKIPVLAIGQGMQLINILCGGTISQHIPEENPRALHHFDPVETIARHVIEAIPGGWIDSIYGPGEIRVNSGHHQACLQLASRFKVSATCPDGVIEAYESIDPSWYCLGVQWHPESETASALDMQIFEHFMKAAAGEAEQPATIPMRRAA